MVNLCGVILKNYFWKTKHLNLNCYYLKRESLTLENRNKYDQTPFIHIGNGQSNTRNTFPRQPRDMNKKRPDLTNYRE